MNSTQEIVDRIQQAYKEKGINISDDELKEKINTYINNDDELKEKINTCINNDNDLAFFEEVSKILNDDEKPEQFNKTIDKYFWELS